MEEQEKLKKLEELKKQREEIDKLIKELLESQQAPGARPQTNIPYAQPFLDQCRAAEAAYAYDVRSADPQELLSARLLINKKCNQLSTDYTHAAAIVEELAQQRNNPLFIEVLARKLLDQGRVQVSSHLESYKPLSYLILKCSPGMLPVRYLQLAIVRQCSPAELRGIYAIYFGYLNLAEDLPACWMWLASVLNCAPGPATGYILEIFLLICGAFMQERCRTRFGKLLGYLRKYFLKEIANAPVEVRLESIIKGYEGAGT